MAINIFGENATNQESLEITVYLNVYTYNGFNVRFVWIPFMQRS